MVCRRSARVAARISRSRHVDIISRARPPLLWLGLVAATLAAASPAHANGRPPLTNGVVFHPNDNEAIYIRSTFGLLVSRDGGCSFRWVCEQAIGYGGIYDPKYAVAADGTLFATTFTGLRVSRDGGCSFTTATAELPAGDPGRIAGTWVDALDLGPTGEVWVATAESGKPNDVYRSTDNGVTFEPRGLASPTIWWKSLKVAPADAQRIYVSGYEVASADADAMGMPRAHLLVTTDGGQTWSPRPLTGLQLGPAPITMVAAVDPIDPQRVYVVALEANGSTGDRLYRSIDGGVTFVEVLATTESIRDVVIRDATTVLVASAAGGTYRSDNGGETFAAIAGGPRLSCLGKRPDGTLIGCGANWDPDFMAVAGSPDASQWRKLFRFVEFAGPLACPVGTPGHDVCDQELWEGVRQQFGATGPKDPACAAPLPADMPAEPPKPGGCCDASANSPTGASMIGALVLWAVAIRRRSGGGARRERRAA